MPRDEEITEEEEVCLCYSRRGGDPLVTQRESRASRYRAEEMRGVSGGDKTPRPLQGL